jgi:hypothetical protein
MDRTFAVPKRRQRVVLHLEPDVAEEGTVFLEPMHDGVPAYRAVAAFFEDHSRFFPFLPDRTGQTEFINKTSVLAMEMKYEADENDSSFPLDLLQREEITVVFRTGNEMRGILLAEVPEERSRLSDCLNLPDKFLSIKSESTIYYINKAAILKVV